MNKKSTYDLFIGLIALMIAIIIALKLMISLPNFILESFYYINIIVWIIFNIDYFGRFTISKNKNKYIFENVIDLISIIPMFSYIIIYMFLGLKALISYGLFIMLLDIGKIIILIIKFKQKIISSIKISPFVYILILTTLIIVISAVVISLLEGISFGDSLWWCFVTFTTVGYGDVLLKTAIGKIVAVILMIVGIGFIGITTSTIAIYIINGGKKKKSLQGEIIQVVKYKLDNFNELSEKDIEDIYKTLKSLK
ncbi:MAG: potassium channel family protein, partial [Clostridium sp.]